MRPANDAVPVQQRSPMEIGLEIVCLVGLLFSYYVLADSWASLPESVPTHFGASGDPDAWGSKWTVLLLPLINTALYLLLTFLRRIPDKLNYPFRLTDDNMERQVRFALLTLLWLKLELVWSFTYIHWTSIQVALGRSDGLGSSFLSLFLGTVILTFVLYFVLAFRNR